MAYDLLVLLKRINNDVYSKFLKKHEFVSGIDNEIGFEIKNIGEYFPGGEINEITAYTAIQLRDLVISEELQIKIPEIPSGKSFHFNHRFTSFAVPGVTRIMFNITPKVEDTIIYYPAESSDFSDDEKFSNVYIVKERLLLEILIQLSDLSGKKEG